jgi:glycosyltransferase involved in cell wall biosynthesis
MRLTAIVPTHNRPGTLRDCLETLRDQEIAPSSFEVVVVDDGSPAEAGIERIVQEVARLGQVEMRCERIDLSGLNGARNRGAAVATGDVLAFLDDDTLISPGWAAALLKAFAEHPCAAVGGKVVLKLAGPEPEFVAKRRYYLAEYDLGPAPRWLSDEPIDGRDPNPVGANCAIRRSDFEALGGFLSGLDRIGKSLISNGDTEFFRRLYASGRPLRYEPEACVAHRVPADRLTVRFFSRRHYAQGLSDELLLALDGRPQGWEERARLLRTLGSVTVRLGKALFYRSGALDAWFEVDYWAGRLAGTFRA